MYRSAFVGLFVVGFTACSGFSASDSPAAPASISDGGTSEGGLPAVGGRADDSLAIEIAPIPMLVQGTTTQVTLKVMHGDGTADPTKLSVSVGLRDGITATSIDVPASATSAELSISVPAAAAQGPLHLTVTASTSLRTVMAPLDTFVRGTPGALDTTFGTQGLARHLFGAGRNAKARDLVVLDDDRLLAVADCGNACVVRTSPDGVLDKAYGTGGSGALSLSFVGQAGSDASGSVFIGGNGGAGSLTVGKLNAAGQPDTAFGNGTGAAVGTTQFGLANGPPEATPPSLAVRKDGAIFLGFPRTHGNGTVTVGLAARAPTGGPLTTFGTNGVTEGLLGGAPFLGFRANGNIWAAYLDSNGCHVTQQDATTGTADPAFDASGATIVPAVGASWVVAGAAALPDGSLVPALHNGTNVVVGKIAADGSHLDLAWGVSGVATVSEDAIPGVSVDKTGLVLVTLLRAGGLRFVRLAANGRPDATFGDNGTVVHSFGMNHQIARALIQKDGRIVVLGTEDFADGSDVSLSRYWN